MTIRDFLIAGGKTIDLDWDRERGFIATEDKDKATSAAKSPKSTYTLKELYNLDILLIKLIK
jgi:hypothetical protein